MQNHLTSLLQQIYETNIRNLPHVLHERTISKRILNTNDYIVNAITTLMCRRYGMVLPNLNSDEQTNTTLPVIPPPPPPPQIFAVSTFDSWYPDPIPPYPSPAQIQEGTRNVMFSSIENPINDACPISLCAFQPSVMVTQIRGCGHIFEQDPIGVWFRTSYHCPACRFDIRTYVATDNENENSQAIEDYESTFSQNATAILNLLSNPTGGGAVVRDLSGNNFMIRSLYDR